MLSSLIILTEAATMQSENTWETLTSMPTERSGFAVAAVEGKIYAIGGDDTTATEMYIPATNTWTTKNSLPQQYGFFRSVAIDKKIYILPWTTVYDTMKNTWEIKTPSPVISRNPAASAVDGKIYMMGGEVGEHMWIQRSYSNEMYDPATDTWSQKTAIPGGGDYDTIVAVALDKKIYVFESSTFATYNVQIYDTTTDSWTTGPAIPQDVSCGGATSGVYAPKKIYLFDGGSTVAYDPATQQWSKGADSALGSNYCVAVVDDVFYAFGGYPSTHGHDSYKYTPFGYQGPALTPAPSTSTSSSVSSSVNGTGTPQPVLPKAILVAGVVVAGVILSSIAVLVYRFRRILAKKAQSN
jgi:N-acetylneuraminic acid mutarotase